MRKGIYRPSWSAIALIIVGLAMMVAALISLIFTSEARGQMFPLRPACADSVILREYELAKQFWRQSYKDDNATDSLIPTFSDIEYFIVLPFTATIVVDTVHQVYSTAWKQWITYDLREYNYFWPDTLLRTRPDTTVVLTPVPDTIEVKVRRK